MNKVICKSCGCENTSEDIFCKNCGKTIMTGEYIEDSMVDINTSYEKNHSAPKKAEKKNNKKRNIIIAVIAVAVVAVIAVVLGIFLLGSNNSPKGHKQLPVAENIIEDLNKDNSITKIEIDGKKEKFKVVSVEIANSGEVESQDGDKLYVIDLSLIRENNRYQTKPVDYTVTYKISDGYYVYDSAVKAKGSKVMLKPLVGVSAEKAQKKVEEYYSGATFKKQDTKLKKGTDTIYFDIENDSCDGSVYVLYEFHNQKGWQFKEINDDELSFKPGVTHKENGLYTNTAVKNIMFFGIDAESYSSRSDCMMLVSIDTNTSKIKLTSFMRDTYVTIPGRGGNKLNSAYALGGPELAVSAIEATYGIDIDNYASTNFATFKNVINALGGVNVNITADEAGYINWQLGQNGQSSVGLVPSGGGNVTLNGQQALWFCRNRGGNGFSGDDFVRTSRQRRVIKSLISSYKSYSPSQVLSTLNNLLGNVSTNLSSADLSWLAENSGKLFDFTIEERCVPDTGEWHASYSSGGAWIIAVNDWAYLTSDIQRYIYEDLK